MPRVVTINRPDVITLIERFAALKTGGNKTEAVALALQAALERESPPRTGTLFGFARGLISVPDGVDLTQPTFTAAEMGDWDAYSGAELDKDAPEDGDP